MGRDLISVQGGEGMMCVFTTMFYNSGKRDGREGRSFFVVTENKVCWRTEGTVHQFRGLALFVVFRGTPQPRVSCASARE